MPSDDRVVRAREAIARPLAVYRSAVLGALDRVRRLLASNDGTSRVTNELGMFARQRIDIERFAALSHGTVLDAAARTGISLAAGVLEEISSLPDDAFVIDLRYGGPLDLVVSSALADFGRAFGAARAAELFRTGRYRPADHDVLTLAWVFRHWSQQERRQSPPLVVTLDGGDLHPAKLASFLDGSSHIILVVQGECAPASLVRLITPGTLVLQTSDDTGLDRFAAFSGPAIAALVPENAAHFIHDPDRGRAAWQRVRVWGRPTTDPRKSLAGISIHQQREELRQLDVLAERPSLPTTTVDALAPAGDGDPGERLATWLLDHSGLGTI